MAVNNSLANTKQTHPGQPAKTGITTFLNSMAVAANIDQALGKDNRQRFITGVISAVNNNTALQECTNKSILSGALLGESLKLSPSPQLGHYYLVPFNDKEQGKVAQFQLGYKGYIQLAIRSGQYKKLNVLAVKEGELEYFDPLNEEIKINLMVDKWDEREEAPTIGYYAMFELTNGFKKAIYWSKKQMMAHADKYSPAFSKDATQIKTKYGTKEKVSFEDYEAGKYDPKDSWMYSSFWYKNFDGIMNSVDSTLDEADGKESSDNAMADVLTKQIGIKVIMKLVGLLLKNLGKIKIELYQFLAGLSGMTEKEIAALPLGTFTQMIVDVFKKEEFSDFFQVVSGLLK